jgi:preprotein translocase subunit SecA
MTRSFGRGTDFIAFDESIFGKNNDGGLHVIQTFLSLENSEEKQIQGRTARQGDPGTFRLIITTNHLDRLKLKPIKNGNFKNEVIKARA